MIAGEKVEAVGQDVAGTVGEAILRLACDDFGVQQMGEVAVEGDLAQANDDTDAGEGLDLAREVGGTVANLLWEGLVAGWGAADDGGDPGVAEPETVVAGDACRLAGKAEFVQDGIHEVAGAVAGEGSAGAIGPVGSGREAEDENAGAWVAEAGNGARPVGFILVGATFHLADTPAVVAKARATLAGGDGLVYLLKERRGCL